MSPAVPFADGFTSDRFVAVMRELEPLSARFGAAGHRLFLVGGTVRDLVARSLPTWDGVRAGGDDFDLDATTTARPPEIKRLLQGWADAVWTQGERFGTIGAMKRVVDMGGTGGADRGVIERVFEITTHRAEAYHDHSRKPEVEFSDDIRADLSRRDFTVNAMAIEVTSPEPVLVDPFGGAVDLVAKVLRTPLTATESFSDDPLRMLRAARFISRYDLTPVPELLDAVGAMGERLSIVSAERVRDELDKLLAATAPAAGLRFVADTGLLRHALPELAASAGVAVPGSVHPDAIAHAIGVASSVEPGGDSHRLARWAALFAGLGPEVARRRLRALRASLAQIDSIGTLVAVLDRLLAGPAIESWTDGEARRIVRDAGGLVTEAVLLARAWASQCRPDTASSVTAVLDAFEHRLATLAAGEDLGDLRPELDGATVMAMLDLPPGREVGAALAHLTELRLDAGLLGADEVGERLRTWWSQRRPG